MIVNHEHVRVTYLIIIISKAKLFHSFRQPHIHLNIGNRTHLPIFIAPVSVFSFFSVSLFFSFSLFLFVSFSLCLFISLSLFLFFSFSLFLSFSLSLCLFVSLSICLFVYLSICLFVSLYLWSQLSQFVQYTHLHCIKLY